MDGAPKFRYLSSVPRSQKRDLHPTNQDLFVGTPRPGAPGFEVGLEAFLGQEADEIDHAVGVAPLVVVPAEDLDAVSDDLGERRVNDGGALVALEIGADEQVLVVAENAFELAFARGLERGIDGLGVCRLLGDVGEIDDGDVWRWDADCESV